MFAPVWRSSLIGILGMIAALGGAGPAVAHDFWLQPSTFWAAPNVATPITLWVGHGADRQRWGADSSRVLLFRGRGPDGDVDYKAALPPGPLVADVALRFATAGTHIVMLESSHATSELPALRFNDYLAKEGLTPAQKQREAAGTTGQPGREIYSRRAKLLMRVGAPETSPGQDVTQPVGLTLEIVPGRSPYDLKPGEDLPLQVIYDGAPLAGALVKLTNLDFDSEPVEAKLTDETGRAAFVMPQTGIWQFNVIWTEPLTGNPAADFDTTFSSLTFGFSPEPKP